MSMPNLKEDTHLMEKLLWTFDRVAQFSRHPDPPVRRWAAERLIKRFPGQAGSVLVEVLDDADWILPNHAARFLADTGDRDRYAPALMARLRRPGYARMDAVSVALARLDHREALPLILERLEAFDVHTDSNEYFGLLSSLGTFGGEQAREALWNELDRAQEGPFLVGAVMHGLLKSALPEDVTRLVETYRNWLPGLLQSRQLTAFAAPTRAASLAEEVIRTLLLGYDAALDLAERWFGREIRLSAAFTEEMISTTRQEYRGVFDMLLREARRLMEERGDRVPAWRAAWDAGQRPPGYRGQAAYTLCLLEAFAAHPAQTRDQREDETGLGLALLFQLYVDRDDQALLEGAEEEVGTLLSILAEDRENVLPDIVERVAALGPDVVPLLVDMLDPDAFGWGIIRATRAIERLASLHRGSCDAAAPRLVAVVHDKQGDFLLEGASAALEAIGPAAVEPIIEHIRDDDLSRQIYLTGSLGEIPTESAAQALLGLLADGAPVEEMLVSGLMAVGSPSAIEPLYAQWQENPDEGSLLEEALLVLCEVNGVEKAELPEWRRAVSEQYKRLDDLRLHGFLAYEQEAILAEEEPRPPLAPASRKEPKQRSVRAPKRVGKKERKRRARQRRGKRTKKKR
jgi:HEAT repeat protein